jgi:VWFA-related protein
MNRGPGKRRWNIPTRVVVCVLCLGLLSPSSAVGGSKKKQTESKKKQQIQLLQQVPLRWRIWLDEEVYPLITKEQRQAFLALDTDAQRRSFAERLWIVWGRQSGLGSAFRRIYDERLELARLELGNTVEDRARILLIHGPPTFRHDPHCPSYFVPMDFWVWRYIEGIGEDVVVLFYQRDLLRHWRIWTTMDGYMGLKPFGAQVGAASPMGGRFDGPAFRCPNGDVTMRLLAAAEMWSRDARYLRAMYHFPEVFDRGGKLESTSHRFMEFSALLDEDAEPLEFSIDNNERAARGGMVEVGFAVDVNVDGLGTTPVGDVDVVQLDVVGEITSREEVMVDKFRYLFSVPHAGDKVGLVLDRLVRPGEYQLRLKVEDVHSKHAAIKVYDFDVDPSLAVTEADDQLGDFADEYGTGMLIGTANEVPVEPEKEEEQPTLRLVGPEGDAVSGLVRFNALVRPEVSKVTFFLDNEAILTKNRPPFDIDLDIGPLPKLTAVMVVGYDASGKEIARDGYTLNVGRERFYVRLKPISVHDAEGGRIRLVAELNIPSDGELEELELFWNDEPLTSIYEPPYEASVVLNTAEQFGYLRALASLSDGSQAEDIQFVNSPRFGTVVKVTAIELPVTVLDNHGDPVTDLTIDDFTVYEDKVEQTISHFSLHRDLPVRMGIVIDTSGSMTATLPTVQRVVMGFLRDLLRPRDRAFIETFSDRPDILAGFTANFSIIENALLALYADRATALYDAVIMGLFQFSGVTGRRAMVVLSDGDDTASKNDFGDALGYAQRMGVTVYTIGINIPTTKVTTRWQISKLASVTGGRAFFVSEKSELGSIYDEINRELRTQYLIAFTSNSERPPDELRKIKVEVDRKKVKVRTITGYYPVGG